jgi:hypothetical protein
MSTTTTIQAGSHMSAVESIPLESIRPRHESKNEASGVIEPAVESGITESDDAPPNAQLELERWNKPRANVPMLAFSFVSFIIAGMNDAATGV